MVQWRSILASDRRTPAGFIVPCRPVLSDKVPTGPEWIHELKWDGYRIIARRDGNRVCLWSRTGRNWTDAFPAIAAAVQWLPVKSVVLDGEAVCLREDGRPDFGALRSRQACRQARLVAFDLLEVNGEDLRRTPPVDRRRARLEALIPAGERAVVLELGRGRGWSGAVPARLRNAPRRYRVEAARLDLSFRPLLTWRKIKCPGYVRP